MDVEKTEKVIENIRMSCVALKNAIVDLKKDSKIDMQKEVSNYFFEPFEEE